MLLWIKMLLYLRLCFLKQDISKQEWRAGSDPTDTDLELN